LATLDEFLAIDGVAAAGEFGRAGSLGDFKSNVDMPQELAAQTAQFCASVSMLFDTLAGSYSQMSGMPWTPQQGWAYSGGDWTVGVGEGGRKGVFIETAKADFNKVFQMLVGER
jgi:roadblock/LC7 domain-containing protein